MVLASCSYMLQPVIAVLRKWGIPFHNPYRPSHGYWNPLRLGSKDSAASRTRALIKPHPDFADEAQPWTFRDLQHWGAWLRNGVLHPNAVDRMENTPTILGGKHRGPASTIRPRVPGVVAVVFQR